MDEALGMKWLVHVVLHPKIRRAPQRADVLRYQRYWPRGKKSDKSEMGPFATGSSQQQVRRCPLCPESGNGSRLPPSRVESPQVWLGSIRPRGHRRCPTAKSVLMGHGTTCPVLRPKVFRLTRRANQRYQLARLTRQEGRLAIVTNVRWDAVDANATTDERGFCGRRSRVVLTPSTSFDLLKTTEVPKNKGFLRLLPDERKARPNLPGPDRP
jgi:hypothetical protein